MNVTIISTGEELICGRIADSNATFLAAGLTERGYDVRRFVAIGDEPDALAHEISHSVADSAAVLVTGGLGPTADDRARSAIACAVGRELVQDEESRRCLEERLRSYGRTTDAHQLAQALFPQGAVIFPNPVGTARGFACRAGESWVVAMPGVPREMRVMFSEHVLPFLLDELSPAGFIRQETVNLFPIPEPDVDERIRDLSGPDSEPQVRITVREGVITVSLTARGGDERQVEELLSRHVALVRERFGDVAFGCGRTTLAAALSDELARRQVTVSVAESVTGGLIGHMLVEVPGISRFFLADVVAYGNEAKERQLGVAAADIAAHGAVSPQVALAMARGVCRATGSRMGISTTGIAGPTGATAEKPVGLVYVAVALDGETAVARLDVRGDRARVRDRSARYALNMARLALLRGVNSLEPGRRI